MDVLVKIVRYFGLWLLNPSYAILTVLTADGDRLVYVPVDRIEGAYVWLERASTRDESVVVCDPARSLQYDVVIDQQVMKIAEDGLATEKELAPSV